ncbi:hypothetical protein AD998_14055 [bacterium 336/3]|nr:hypothetical protein AD998_14055 [bacterium 336/3]
MKKVLLLFTLLPLFCFSQNITKRELRKIIKECIRINKARFISDKDLILVANNTDSSFFNTINLTVYTDRQYDFCKWIEFCFLNKKNAYFKDCQACKEPSTCYSTTEKNIYNYKIIKENKELTIEFKNKFECRLFQILETKRDKSKRITEILITQTINKI